MGEADAPHDRGGHARRRADGARRARGGLGGARRVRRRLRPPRGRRLRQGQQRRRRSGRRARAARPGGCGSTTFALDRRGRPDRFARALDRADVVVDAMFGTGFRGALDGDAAWVVASDRGGRRARRRGRHPVGRRRAHRRGRRTGVRAPTGPSRSPRRKPGLVFEPGPVARRARSPSPTSGSTSAPVARQRVTEAADVAAWLPPRDPSTHKWAVGGVMVVGGTTGHDRRADVREPRGDARRRGHRLVRGPGRAGRGRRVRAPRSSRVALPATARGRARRRAP